MAQASNEHTPTTGLTSAVNALSNENSMKTASKLTNGTGEPHEKHPPKTIDQMMRFHATDPGFKDEPSISYPRNSTDYVDYTPAQIYAFANTAAARYATLIPRRVSSDDPVLVIALLAASTFDYLITQLAISKLGHTVLLLSTRISLEAHVSLLERCQASALFAGDGFRSIAAQIVATLPHLKVNQILTQESYSTPPTEPPTRSDLDVERETRNVAWIIHSSGSTNLPKPIFISHARAIGNYSSQITVPGLITVPLFHANGLGTVFRSMNNRQQLYLYSGAAPLTASAIAATLQQYPHIRCLYAVPYALKLLSEHANYIALLARLDAVVFAGAACPKPLGDRLAAQGVLLVALLGATETGQTMTSVRPRAALLEWDWLRPVPAFAPYVRWEPYVSSSGSVAGGDSDGDGDGGGGGKSLELFEMVVRDGWAAKTASNRPDGAWATSDLFERHPDFPRTDAWRYYARKDDTIVLANGEKANPLLLEGAAMEAAEVREAVAFGGQRDRVGMFLVPADERMSEAEVVAAVWPGIERANRVMPAHGRLSKDMIRILPPDQAARLRKTDKGSLIRPGFYRDFAELIDAVYAETAPRGSLVLDEDQLREHLLRLARDIVRHERRDFLTEETDLFSLGVDSLQVSQLRAAILRDIDVGGHQLGINFAFEYPSINAMARELYRLRTGGKECGRETIEQRMQVLIDKYSVFDRPEIEKKTPPAHGPQTVLVTGVTGSLGIHIVAQLAQLSNVSKIICLVRAETNDEARRRFEKSLTERKLRLDTEGNAERIEVYASNNLGLPLLGLTDESTYTRIAREITAVIHCAWSVNFNLSLASFEHDCIAGTAALLAFCASYCTTLPRFAFCSSISTASRTPGPDIPETLPTSLSYAQPMGYAQSKLVAEHVCAKAGAAIAGFDVRILRIGQIVGDTVHGVWNASEATTLTLRAAARRSPVAALPSFGKGEERCSWLPVDVVAAGAVELALSPTASSDGVYHVVNHATFDWSADLLPLLRAAGLVFETVAPAEWLRRLRATPDPRRNPPYRLIEFFTRKYGQDRAVERKTFQSEKAREVSAALREASVPDQALINKIVCYLQSVWTDEGKSV